MVKRIVVMLVILLVIIQFFRPEKNIHPGVQPNAITLAHPTPANVSTLLHTACYDCHSNNTLYPWYYNIQPVAWWLRHHINEGKRELNFDEFQTYTVKKQLHKLEEVTKQIKEGEMPIASYTLIHTDARLTEEDKKLLIDWANNIRNSIGGANATSSAHN